MELIFAIGLAFFSLLTLAAGLGLKWLRAREGLGARRQAELAPRARQLIQAFSLQARRQLPDPGPPYTSLLVEAGKTARRGWARAKQVDARLRRNLPAITARRLSQCLLVVPIYQDWFQRLGMEWELFKVEHQVRLAETELVTVRTRLEDAAGLGKLEQTLLNRLRAETGALKEAVTRHLLSTALAPEQKKLVDLNERLLLAGIRLGESEPTPTDVALTHPILLEIEKELDGVRQALRGHETAQQRLQPLLARASERLSAFEQALLVEESRRSALKLHERAETARRDLASLKNVLAQGDYILVEQSLTGLNSCLNEMEEVLKKLSTSRTRLIEIQEQTGQTLSGLHQWMRQFPAPFILDTAQEWVHVLQTKLQEQACAIGSEDPAELERAGQVPFDEIRNSQSSFEQSLGVVNRLGDRLDPVTVAGLLKRGEHLASRLKLRHLTYQAKAHLPALEEHIARLDESWKLIATADPNRQSDLKRIGQVLQQVDSAWNEVERDIERAFSALELAKTQQEQALVRLDDEAFDELFSLSQPQQDEWSLAARGLLEQRQALVDRTGKGDEDFNAVLSEADALWRGAAKFVKEVQFRLARAQLEASRLVAELNTLADQMERLENHPYLNFKEQIAGVLGEVQHWLGQAQTPNLAGLGRWNILAEQGVHLRQEAELLSRSMESETTAADQDRAWTEDMLVTAEEYQGSARDQLPPNAFNGELAASRNLLETARRKLQALAAPRRKYLLAEYLAELADVRQMIHGARAHVDVVLNAG